jgi:hypothetical protein
MTGRSWLASASGIRPETTAASSPAEMNRRVKCFGNIPTYAFKVATSGWFAVTRLARVSVPLLVNAGLIPTGLIFDSGGGFPNQ